MPRIAEAAVVCRRLDRVARDTQRLPAGRIEEPGRITLVRSDVIDNSCGLTALAAARKLSKKGSALLPPSKRVQQCNRSLIAMVGVVTVTSGFVAPTEWSVRRRSMRHVRDFRSSALRGTMIRGCPTL